MKTHMWQFYLILVSTFLITLKLVKYISKKCFTIVKKIIFSKKEKKRIKNCNNYCANKFTIAVRIKILSSTRISNSLNLTKSSFIFVTRGRNIELLLFLIFMLHMLVFRSKPIFDTEKADKEIMSKLMH